VLLLLLSRGAHGLTLTEANHCFLLEPILSAQAEAQAINRIQRIGQTKPTIIHRYIVRDSVEERLHRWIRRQRSETTTGRLLATAMTGRGAQAREDFSSLSADDLRLLVA
jgi:E3 ubiquitin-protein ligase SHPRH